MTENQARAIARDMLDVGHFLFDGASWAFYDYVLHWRDHGGHYARITYDRGQMEVFTGADVKWALEAPLTKVLAGFILDQSVPPALATDLTAADDVIYVVSRGSMVSPPAESRNSRVPDGSPSIELHVARSKVLTGGGDADGGRVQRGPLRFSGIVRTPNEESSDLPGRVVFPGLEPGRLIEFVMPSQKGKKSQ